MGRRRNKLSEGGSTSWNICKLKRERLIDQYGGSTQLP